MCQGRFFPPGSENGDMNGETEFLAVFHLSGQRIHMGLGQREQGLSEEVEEAVSTQVRVFMEIEEKGEGRGG